MSRRFSIALITAGLLLIALGLCSGDVARVLIKAQRFCLECIGIG
ncbi:MAG: CD1871A family CXXC motif-containing protein [Thermacetogeniaceae bacterium]